MTETVENFVISLYLGLMDRMPDEDGLRYWTNQLTSGEMTEDAVIKSFLASQEFDERSESINASEIIQTIYSNAFDRVTDEAGLGYWTEAVTSGTPLATVIKQILFFVHDAENLDGLRLKNAIESVQQTRQTAKDMGVTSYWEGAEVDGVTSDRDSLTLQNSMERVRLKASAPSPSKSFDNVVNGDDIDDTTIEGTPLNDLIILGSKTAVAYGFDGDDLFQGSANKNYFWPGAGNDTVEAGSGSDTIDARFDAPASNRDNFYGQDGDDYIFGGEGDEFIDGGDGKDFVDAGGGRDVIRGGTGDDTLAKSGGGIFNILGEAGNDKVIISGGGSGTVDGGSGSDTIELTDLDSFSLYAMSGDDIITAQNIEHYSIVKLGEGNDQFTGTDINGLLIDTVNGNNHIVLRNANNVTITLGSGNDTVELIDCENVLVKGGKGDDTFRVTTSRNITLLGEEDEDNFYVDSESLATQTMTLHGGGVPAPDMRDSLIIEGLATGDRLTLNEDNFAFLNRLTFDHTVRATILFESNPQFGVGIGNFDYGPGRTINGSNLLRVYNSNNKTVQDIQSDIWLMQGDKPYDQTSTGIGFINNGNWNAGGNSISFGDKWKTNLMVFQNIEASVYNPYNFDGNLMLSWVV